MESLGQYLSNPLVRNYLKILSVDVLVKASGFILLPVYLALMTQAEFGLYGYVAAVVATFSLVFNLGLYAAQTKLYHNYPEEERGSILFTLNVILAGFLGIVMVALFYFRLDVVLIRALIHTPFDYEGYRPGVCLGMLAAVYSMLLINYFLTSDQIRRVQQFNLSRAILINAVVLTALWMLGGDHARIRLLYAALTEAVLILVLAVPYVRAMRVQFHREAAKRALAIGFPIMLSAVAGVIINLSDRFFIEKYGTLEDLSKYNLALTLASVIPFAFASFQNVWLPEVLKEKDPERSRARTRSMVIKLTIALVGIGTAIMVMFTVLLGLGWISPMYQGASGILPITLATAIMTAISGMYTNQLIYLERLPVVVVTTLVVGAFGLLLNQWLVPSLNILGAALVALAVNGAFALVYGLLVAHFHRQKQALT